MPSVMDAPELETEDVETYDLTIETIARPEPRGVRSGFWRTLRHGLTAYLISTPRERHAPVCSIRRPFETPMDRLVREHPSLATYVLAII
jgi:hypothetical protein